MEHKNLPLELKDLDVKSRTALIAHAAYDNIDRTKDISRKGMFTKSWADTGSQIKFYKNHDDTTGPGKVIGTSEDSQKAYTHVKLGTHTEGNDTLIMMDEGIITDASFGYKTIKSNNIEIKGQKVRELKEVWHGETSVLTKMPANPLAGVVSVTKMFEDKSFSDLEKAWLQSHIEQGQMDLMNAMGVAQQLKHKDDLYTRIQGIITQRSNELSDLKNMMHWDFQTAGKSFFDAVELKSYIYKLEKFIHNSKASDECIEAVTEEMKSASRIVDQFEKAVVPKIKKIDNFDELTLALSLLRMKL